MEQRYLADSNTIIDYVGNKMPDKALVVLDSYFNDNLVISIISKIEVLGFNGDVSELKRLRDFIGLATTFFVDDAIADKTIELRKAHKIKTPDAIIAATALVYGLTLITRNTADFKNIDGLQTVNPHEL
ncbi:MAG: type II toxin-antitoxin system VapC family toxin [Ferruginibacter sp.]